MTLDLRIRVFALPTRAPRTETISASFTSTVIGSPRTLRDRLLAGVISEAEAVRELEAIPGFNEAIAEARSEEDEPEVIG